METVMKNHFFTTDSAIFFISISFFLSFVNYAFADKIPDKVTKFVISVVNTSDRTFDNCRASGGGVFESGKTRIIPGDKIKVTFPRKKNVFVICNFMSKGNETARNPKFIMSENENALNGFSCKHTQKNSKYYSWKPDFISSGRDYIECVFILAKGKG